MTKWKIALLATQWLLLSGQTIPEPFPKSRALTPDYVEYLRTISVLPPEEFDREYKGETKVTRGTQTELRQACPGTFKPGNMAIGCAFVYSGVCLIFIAEDNILQTVGYDGEIVLRHERAHCNGWHHPR